MAIDIDRMIRRLEFYVRFRQLGIAEVMVKEFRNEASTNPFKESGYAILSVVMAYFEMFEQFDRGQSSHGQSREFFRCGFRKVYSSTSLTDEQINTIYSWVRCGMYHTSLTAGFSPLSRNYPVGFDVEGGEIRINPGKVVQDLFTHFDAWVAVLKKPACTGNRFCFEKAARMIGMDRPEAPLETPGTSTQAPWEPG
ncbi:hypothetical protein [Fimbriiglobus ruber]|uniref:hypothetical protein n=1 Tax=Fimbriiglobus ruber TaxID=1908690 RepID=UPI00117A6F38|nr:hypothetical protein [Fimbriiglobus ruber]